MSDMMTWHHRHRHVIIWWRGIFSQKWHFFIFSIVVYYRSFRLCSTHTMVASRTASARRLRGVLCRPFCAWIVRVRLRICGRTASSYVCRACSRHICQTLVVQVLLECCLCVVLLLASTRCPRRPLFVNKHTFLSLKKKTTKNPKIQENVWHVTLMTWRCL